MKPSIRHPDKRIIAFVMLVVWMFTLGAGLANACLIDGLRSEPLDHHDRLASTSPSLAATATHGGAGPPPAHDGDDHGRSHLVHCQPSHSTDPGPLSSQANEKPIDADAIIVATGSHWPRPSPSTDRQPTVRQTAGPGATDLPLFIRFRRLIP